LFLSDYIIYQISRVELRKVKKKTTIDIYLNCHAIQSMWPINEFFKASFVCR